VKFGLLRLNGWKELSRINMDLTSVLFLRKRRYRWYSVPAYDRPRRWWSPYLPPSSIARYVGRGDCCRSYSEILRVYDLPYHSCVSFSRPGREHRRVLTFAIERKVGRHDTNVVTRSEHKSKV